MSAPVAMFMSTASSRSRENATRNNPIAARDTPIAAAAIRRQAKAQADSTPKGACRQFVSDEHARRTKVANEMASIIARNNGLSRYDPQVASLMPTPYDQFMDPPPSYATHMETAARVPDIARAPAAPAHAPKINSASAANYEAHRLRNEAVRAEVWPDASEAQPDTFDVACHCVPGESCEVCFARFAVYNGCADCTLSASGKCSKCRPPAPVSYVSAAAPLSSAAPAFTPASMRPSTPLLHTPSPYSSPRTVTRNVTSSVAARSPAPARRSPASAPARRSPAPAPAPVYDYTSAAYNNIPAPVPAPVREPTRAGAATMTFTATGDVDIATAELVAWQAEERRRIDAAYNTNGGTTDIYGRPMEPYPTVSYY